MAGAGFKTFGVGDVLTASDVNGYLMQQAVMNFADSGARGSAIGTATEGMVSYLQDTDTVEVYDGSAWTALGAAGIGSNAVTDLRTTTFSASLASGSASSNVVEVTITPTTNTSRIIVFAYTNASSDVATNRHTAFRLVRGATALAVGDASGSRTQSTGGVIEAGVSTANIYSMSAIVLDSPATTSAVTYGLQLVNPNVGTQNLYANRTVDNSDAVNRIVTSTAITAIEVAA